MCVLCTQTKPSNCRALREEEREMGGRERERERERRGERDLRKDQQHLAEITVTKGRIWRPAYLSYLPKILT